MRVVNRVDQNSWESFVQKHPSGNIFHSPEMFTVFAETSGYQPEVWAVEDDQGQILALMLPVRIELSPYLRSFTSRSVAFGGILYSEGPLGDEALGLLLQSYVQQVEQPPLFTELRNLADLSAAQPSLAESGFIYEEHLNYLIDISQTPDEVFQGIGRRTRKNIRRGLNRKKVLVEQVTDHERLTSCIDLIMKTYERARVPLAHRSLFENAFDILVPNEMMRVTMASVDGQPAATSLELLFRDVVYGWYSGLDRSYSSYVPNELLMWEILKWGSEGNYQVYDFGGAGKPDQSYGVRDFKAKFGGDLVGYGRNTYVHRPGALKISRAGYRVYQAIKNR